MDYSTEPAARRAIISEVRQQLLFNWKQLLLLIYLYILDLLVD